MTSFGMTSYCALVATLLLAGCSSAPRNAPATSPPPRAAYPHTEADVHFMSAMIGHHSQALVMAAWAPSHGASPAIRRLAERLINGQQDEIVTMQRWLRDRGEEPTGPGHHGRAMPGMLSDDQLQQLDRARGAEFDRLFLRFMIQHHRGAVTMVQQLFATPRAAQDETVFKFANDVSVDQSTEIRRMEQMLDATHPANSAR